ncbi:hypothetical protein ACLB2K_001616 [Fragaria x ananassa]
MGRDEDLCFYDNNGKKYRDYISFGAEEVARLRGQTPVQIYSDFIKSFAENFMEYMGGVIQDVHITLGPEGELKYPSGNSHTICRSPCSSATISTCCLSFAGLRKIVGCQNRD